jgi:hypothetical protein
MVGPLLKPNNTEQNSYPFHDHTCILKLMINDLVNRNICVTYNLGYIMFVVITIRSFRRKEKENDIRTNSDVQTII